MKSLLSLALLWAIPAMAALRTYHHNGDLAMWDDAVPTNGKLLLTIQGTGASATGLTIVQEEAAKLGYQVIAVAYQNQVITTVCRTSSDSLCFDNFRREIMYGVDVSDKVQVSPAQGLMNRIHLHMRHLALQPDTSLRYGQFMNAENFIRWSLMTVVGHSQGAGHAAYLGKQRRLEAVIMAAGPQDAFENGAVANWIQSPGRTPRNSHFGILHRDDFFGVRLQQAVQRHLSPTPHVQVHRERTQDPHNAMVLHPYRGVWSLLFNRLMRRVL